MIGRVPLVIFLSGHPPRTAMLQAMPHIRACSRCSEPTTNPSWCPRCTSAYLKNYKRKNREKIRTLNQRWMAENRETYAAQRRQHRKTPAGRCVELVAAAKKRAKRRHLSFDLTSKETLRRWQEQSGCCALTGLPFQLYADVTLQTGQWDSPSIDRLDCNKGYVESNVRLICYGLNCCLHDFGEDVFRRVAGGAMWGGHRPHSAPEIADYSGLSQKQRDDKKYARSISGMASHLHHAAKRNASDKGLLFSLTKDVVKTLLTKQASCAVSHVPFDYQLRRKRRANPFRPSIDRVDSKGGYTQGNIRLVSVIVNYGLNNFGDEVFHLLCSSFLTPLIPVEKT